MKNHLKQKEREEKKNNIAHFRPRDHYYDCFVVVSFCLNLMDDCISVQIKSLSIDYEILTTFVGKVGFIKRFTVQRVGGCSWYLVRIDVRITAR